MFYCGKISAIIKDVLHVTFGMVTKYNSECVAIDYMTIGNPYDLGRVFEILIVIQL